MTRKEALYVARHIAAGAHAMAGCGADYCEIMREGRFDDEPAVQAAAAALLLSSHHLKARLDDFHALKSNVVEMAA